MNIDNVTRLHYPLLWKEFYENKFVLRIMNNYLMVMPLVIQLKNCRYSNRFIAGVHLEHS